MNKGKGTRKTERDRKRDNQSWRYEAMRDHPTPPPADDEENPITPAQEGERSPSGTQPATSSDDDVADMIEDVIGNTPQSGKPFSLAEEVEKDERGLRDIPPDEAKVAEDEGEEENRENNRKG